MDKELSKIITGVVVYLGLNLFLIWNVRNKIRKLSKKIEEEKENGKKTTNM